MPGRVRLGPNRFNRLGDADRIEAGDVLDANVHLTVRVFRLRRSAAVETTQHQQRRAIGRGDSSSARDARDSEPFFQHRGHRGKAVGGFELPCAVAFVEHDAKSGLIFDAHSSVHSVTASLSFTKILFPAITGYA